MSHDDPPAGTEPAAPGLPPAQVGPDDRNQVPPLTPGPPQLPMGQASGVWAASPSGTGYGTPQAGWSGPPPPSGYPPWGGYPGSSQPAPARSGRVHVGWLIAAVLITAVTVGSVAGGAGYIIGQRHTATAAARPQKGTGGLTPPAGGGGIGGCSTQLASTEPALTSLLVPVPQGASRDGSLPFTQALSLSQFVSDVYKASQHQAPVLSTLCFQAAARRAYVTAPGEVVVTYLIRFDGDENAEAYTLRTIAGDRAEKGITTDTAVPGVTDGRILCRPSLDQYGNTLCHVLAVRGNIAILMHVYEPGKLPAQSVVKALLRKQFARL